MELILGHAGENHITSQHMRNLFAGIVGEGSYILSGMEPSVVSANQVRISEGGGIVQGAYFETASGAESVTIDNGTQGLKRHDLICAEYSITGGIENMELVVVKGTPSATPQDPSYTSGKISSGATVQFPFYRVRLDGLSVDGIDTIATAPDYILETGTYLEWTWEKWASGKAKAWRRTERENYTFPNGTSPVFWSGFTSYTLPPGLFVADPIASLATASEGVVEPWLENGSPNTQYIRIGYLRFATATPATITTHMQLTGRWK